MPEDSTQPQIGGSLQPDGWAASFLAKLDAEIAETEGAKILARDGEHWPQYHRLTGQLMGLIQAKRWLKETQPNRPSSPTANR